MKKVWLGVLLLVLVGCTQETVSPEPEAEAPVVTPAENQPSEVVVDAGAPLVCRLLDEPRKIGDLTANYGCDAPGAYLSEVDVVSRPMWASYFTSDTQGTTVTYGPELMEIVEYK